MSILRDLIQEQARVSVAGDGRTAENLLTESPFVASEASHMMDEEGESRQVKGIKEVKWKYAVGLNNMAVEHQYLGQ